MDVLGLIGSGLTAASGIANSFLSNEQASERERAARQENYELNEKAAQNADVRTRALYYDLYSPQAQLQQIKNAGLSPSLFYGDGGGISGQTGAQGAGAAGISPQSFGIPPLDLAQIGKINAETELIKAQTKTEKGENERGQAEIESIIAGTNNKNLQAVYQEYKNALAEIDLTVSASTQENQIENYIAQTRYLEHLVTSAGVKAEIDEKSKNDVLDFIKEQAVNLAADTLLKGANTALAKQNVQLSKQQVKDLANQITNRNKMTEVNQNTLKAQIEQWGKQNGLKDKEIGVLYDGVIVNGAVNGVNNLVNILKFANSLKGTPRVSGL